jgi:hypothetical protein
MTIDDLITGIKALIAAYEAEAVQQPLMISAGGDLQAALDAGEPLIALPAGATYPAITIAHPVTLNGNGAHIHAVASDTPAIRVAPGTTDVTLRDLSATAAWNGAVVQLGDNLAATQGTLAVVPRRIRLERVTVPTHRGKRAFEISAAECELVDCSCDDVYVPDGAQDSQGVNILNTPGPVAVRGGTYIAGSENIMIGGAAPVILGNVPSDLLFENLTLVKPAAWQNAIKVGPKNLFEIKAGRRVTLRNSTLSGSWKSTLGDPSQDGYAIVITPKNSMFIEDVLLEGLTVDRCASGVQLLGVDYNSVTPHATRGIVIRASTFAISKALYGGIKGHLALYVGGMLDSTWEDVSATFDGAQIVECDSPTPTGPLTMRGCTLSAGVYGFKAPGANYGNVGYADRAFTALLEGNTFDLSAMSAGGRTAFKTNFPTNTFTP